MRQKVAFVASIALIAFLVLVLILFALVRSRPGGEAREDLRQVSVVVV